MYKAAVEASLKQLKEEKIGTDKFSRLSAILTQTARKVADLQRESCLRAVKQVLEEWDGSYINSEAVYAEILSALKLK